MEVDYIVVGGGSAGCVLAARLSEDPSVSVALLEAGGNNDGVLNRVPTGAAVHIIGRNAFNWAFSTVPQPGFAGRRGYQPRGRGLGGSSSINAMVYLRGQREDYDDWVADGATGWGWSDVLPYFRRSENNERAGLNGACHGRGGPLNVADLRSPHPFAAKFIEAAQQAGLQRNDDFAGETQEGVGWYQVTQKNGERWSVARAYLDPARGRPNLKIEMDAFARQVLFDGRRAVGVRFDQGGQTREVRARREVLLAAGALQSPQLLMVSGVGPGDHLKEFGIATIADLPVGENLQDHPDVIINRRVDNTDLLGLSPVGAWKLMREIGRWRRERRGVLTSNFAEAGAFVRTLPDQARPDLQLHFVIGMVDNHNRTLHWGHGMSCHSCPLRPKSRGVAAPRLARHEGRPADRSALPVAPGRSRDAGARLQAGAEDLRAAGVRAFRRRQSGARAVSRRSAHRRRHPCGHPRARRHDLSPGRHLPHGQRRRARWSIRSCACAASRDCG